MNLEQLKWQLGEYAKSPESKRVVEKLMKLIVDENQDNVVAFLPTRTVDLNQFDFDLQELNFGEDFEASFHWTADVPDEKGNTSNEQLEDHERVELLEKLNDEIEDLEGKRKLTKKEEKHLDHIRAVRDAWDGAEQEYDELYYNWGWSPGHSEVDEPLALRLGFSLIKFLAGAKEDETFMMYGGGGMDLSPKLVAYIALKYGWVDPEHVSKFTGYNIDYLQSVMGETIFNEVIEKLGVTRQVAVVLKQKAKERARQERARKKDEALKARKRKKRPSAALRKVLSALPPPKDGPWTFSEVYTEILTLYSTKKIPKAILKEFSEYSGAFHRHDDVADLVGVTVASYVPPPPAPEPKPAETPADDGKGSPAEPSPEPAGE